MRRKMTISLTAVVVMMMMANNSVLANWEQTDGGWNYKENGQNITNTWKQVDGKWYYFNGTGEMQSGWLEKDGKWYYLDPNSGDMKEGWVQDGEKWYYLNNATGEMQSGWLEKDGKWYYLDPNNGDMKEGWVQDKEKWYYLNSTTGEMATGWAKTDGKWYFLDSSGCMQTGIIEVNGKVYALDEASGAMQTGTVLLKNGPSDAYTFDPVTGEAIGNRIPIPTKAYRSNGEKQEDLSASVKEKIQQMQREEYSYSSSNSDSSDDSDDSDNGSSNNGGSNSSGSNSGSSNNGGSNSSGSNSGSSNNGGSNNSGSNNNGSGSDSSNSGDSSEDNNTADVNIQEITVPKSGMVDVVLSKAVSLDSSNFYISCPAGKDMTILDVKTESGENQNKVYHITTSYFSDNTYNMEITLPNGKKIEKTFVTSLAAPEIKEIETKRVDKNTADISFISDSAGIVYYMAVPTDASRQVRLAIGEQVPQTGKDVQEQGDSMQMNQQGIYDLTIKDLKENQAYTIYLAAAQTEGEEAVLRGSALILAQPEGGDFGENVGNIEIEEADAVSDSKIKVVLNKPTQEALTLENIDVECSKGDVRIGGIQTEDNQTYYIPMQENWFMNSGTGYTVHITLPDGSKLEKKFYTDFDYPNLNEKSIRRIAEDEIEVTFRSDEGGVFYYGTTNSQDTSDLPTADEIVETGFMKNLSGGENKFTMKIDKDDKLFYLVPVDQKGNRPPRFAESIQIPSEIEDEPVQEPDKVTEIEDISYTIYNGYHRLTVTLRDVIDTLAIEKESIKIYPLDGQVLTTQPKVTERGESWDGWNIFYIQFNIKFPDGRYELEFMYDGAYYKKEFEIK